MTSKERVQELKKLIMAQLVPLAAKLQVQLFVQVQTRR